ncbi:unnamed protein product [Effrenium voratum]|nr:unnamed protein product [Effrenium voratum]
MMSSVQPTAAMAQSPNPYTRMSMDSPCGSPSSMATQVELLVQTRRSFLEAVEVNHSTAEVKRRASCPAFSRVTWSVAGSRQWRMVLDIHCASSTPFPGYRDLPSLAHVATWGTLSGSWGLPPDNPLWHYAQGVLVQGMPRKCKPTDVSAMLDKFVNNTDIRISHMLEMPMNRDGTSRGFAFVHARAVAAKDIATAFYGRRLRKNSWRVCSVQPTNLPEILSIFSRET